MMKPSIYLPLLGALVILLAWTVVRYTSGHELNQGSATVRGKTTEGLPLPGPRTRSGEGHSPAKEVNWADLDDGHGNMRDFTSFKKQLPLMSRDQLTAQLYKLGKLNLTDAARLVPESMLLNELIARDAEFALRKYIDRARQEDSAYGQILPKAMGLWAKKEPAQAIAWLDEQIAKGMFPNDSSDEMSMERQRFEHPIIGVLLGADSNLATERLDAILNRPRVPLPGEGQAIPSESATYLRNVAQWVDTAGEKAFADLVRSHIDSEGQADVIAAPVDEMASGTDLSKVTEYLNRIEATPMERASCANAVVGARLYAIAPNRRVTLDDLNDMIRWTTDNAPNAVGSVTGQFLASVSIQQGQMTFAEAAANATAYHDASHNDDILVEFLKNSDSSGDSNRALARVMAKKISDEQRRSAVMETLQ